MCLTQENAYSCPHPQKKKTFLCTCIAMIKIVNLI